MKKVRKFIATTIYTIKEIGGGCYEHFGGRGWMNDGTYLQSDMGIFAKNGALVLIVKHKYTGRQEFWIYSKDDEYITYCRNQAEVIVQIKKQLGIEEE